MKKLVLIDPNKLQLKGNIHMHTTRSDGKLEPEEAARRYAMEKAGMDPDAPKAVDLEKCPSGIAERPFCKGRNYDPDRYSKK